MSGTVDAALPLGQLERVSGARFLPGDDSKLVADARAGDERAFGRLYEIHAPMVHGLLLARVPPSEVEDLMQEVFLQAMRRMRSLREPAAFGGWLASIARSKAADHFRKRRDAHELPEEVPAPATPLDDAREALDAILSLPMAYRETLILRLVEGMTGPEISARTGLTEGSVRVNLHRGMKRLKEKLGAATEKRHE